MAKAKVELVGAASHTRSNGHVIKSGRSETVLDAASIAYYKAQAGFVVTDLNDEEPPSAPVAQPAKAAAKEPEKKKGFFSGKSKAETGDEEAPL